MARRPDGSYVDDDDYYGATNATYGPPPERFESKVEISVRELTALRAEIAAAQEAARTALAGQVALTLDLERLRAVLTDIADGADGHHEIERKVRAALSEGAAEEKK